MMLAHLLDSEEGVGCLHEGNRLGGDGGRRQVLEYLTLQNLVAYHSPADALNIIQAKRAGMAAVAEARGIRLLGDIAYNYAPFVSVLPRASPGCRLIAIFRDGREFVRSVMTAENPDPTPVGWLDRPPSTRVERYIALGRLRPAPHDPLAAEWPTLSAVARNAWLWAETNRLILDGLQAWNPQDVISIKFESLMADLGAGYESVRSFLGIVGPMSEATWRLCSAPINPRREKPMPPWSNWQHEDQEDFRRFAGAMMLRLGYQLRVDGSE
jgi:hypothetical protein